MTPEQKREFFKPNFTLKGQIYYPNLLAPKAKRDGGREIYDVMFAFKAEENAEVVAQMAAFMGKAKETFHASIPLQFWVNPIKKFETYVRQDGKANADFLKGKSWFNASTGKDFPPVIVDKNRQPIVNPAEVYSGRNAVINCSFWVIDNEKKGLSMNVVAVLLLDGGEKVASSGGGGQADVSKIFGSFVADSAPTTGSNNNGGTFGGFV